MTSEYLDRPRRSLTQVRDELVANFNALPLTSRERGPLATRIREVEAAIDEMEPPAHPADPSRW